MEKIISFITEIIPELINYNENISKYIDQLFDNLKENNLEKINEITESLDSFIFSYKLKYKKLRDFMAKNNLININDVIILCDREEQKESIRYIFDTYKNSIVTTQEKVELYEKILENQVDFIKTFKSKIEYKKSDFYI